jgi:hypothetical protein
MERKTAWRFWRVYLWESTGDPFPRGLYSPYYHDEWPHRRPFVAEHRYCSSGWPIPLCGCGIWASPDWGKVIDMAREYAAANDAVVAYGRVYIWGDIRRVDDWYLAKAAYPASPVYISVPSRYAVYLPSFTQRLTRLYGVDFLPGEPRKDIPID